MPAFSDIKDYVLFALAIYAAGLSTWNLWQSLEKNKRQVMLTLNTSLPVFGNNLGNAWATVEATNIGHRPVTITFLTIEIPSGGRIVRLARDGGLPGKPDTPLPVVLNDSQTARVSIPYVEIGEALIEQGVSKKVQIWPVCEDSSGGIHRGKAWIVDPKELVGM